MAFREERKIHSSLENKLLLALQSCTSKPNPNLLHCYIERQFWPYLKGPGAIWEAGIWTELVTMCSVCLHVPVMSWLVETDPRHRCILAHWHSIMLWEVSRVGHWTHYLWPISEGPLLRGSGPIAASVSVSEAKSNRCLPRCWVEKTSCLELLWNTLLEKKRRVEQWTKIKNSEGSQERWKKEKEQHRTAPEAWAECHVALILCTGGS